MLKATTLFLFAVLAPCAAQADRISTASSISHCLMTGDLTPTSFNMPAATIADTVPNASNDVLLVVGDATGHVLVTYERRNGLPVLRPGDIASLSGEMVPGVEQSAYNVAKVSTATLIRHGTPPKPEAAAIGTLLGGSMDWKPVRVSGLIREALQSDTNSDWMHLALCSDGCRLHISTPLNGSTPEDFKALIGATVCITGFCNPQDRSRRLYQGRVFHCHGRDAFRIVRPRPENLFDSPSIDALHYRQPSEIAALGPHCAHGQIVAVWQKRLALLRTASGESVRLSVISDRMPYVGEVVDTYGFPESNLFDLTL